MPIYEYVCSECQHKFECLVNLNKETRILCPRCQSEKVKKLVSSFGIGGGVNRLKTSKARCASCSSSSCSTCK